jgi:phage I-like protein
MEAGRNLSALTGGGLAAKMFAMTHTLSSRLAALGLVVAAQTGALSLVGAAAAETAPEWIAVMPAGTFAGQDGRGPYTVKDPQALIAASQIAGRPIPVDYNHQTVFACLNGGDAPAAGWIDKFEVRDGGQIWAHVDWTEDGGKDVASKKYRFVSPAFKQDAEGNITSIESVALVNSPNLAELPVIHSQTGEVMDEFLKQLRAALGLPAEADQAAVIAACKTNTAGVSAQAATFKEIAVLVGLKPEASHIEVASGVKTKIATGAPDPALFVPMSAFKDLQTQVATLTGDAASKTAAAAVDAAVVAGKVSPAMKGWATDYASKDPTGFAEWAKTSPAIVRSGPIVPEKLDPATVSLGDAEIEVASRLGISIEDMRKTKVAA